MRCLRNISAFAVTAFPLLLSSLPSWAEEAGAGEKGGLPQLDTSLFPEQLFWLAVNFAVLYVLMSFVALPRVSKTQGNRKTVIASEIEAARLASDSAKVMVASVEKSLNEARSRAQTSVSEMMAEVTETAYQHRVAKEKELSRQLHRAEEDIAVTREAAMKEVQVCATDLAQTIVGKILGSGGRVSA